MDVTTGEIIARKRIGHIHDHQIGVIQIIELEITVEVNGVATAHSMVSIQEMGTNLLVTSITMDFLVTIHLIRCIVSKEIRMDNIIQITVIHIAGMAIIITTITIEMTTIMDTAMDTISHIITHSAEMTIIDNGSLCMVVVMHLDKLLIGREEELLSIALTIILTMTLPI